jgi:hypothetical protein
MGNVVTGLEEQESTRLYDLMRCEATMTAKDEVAHKHTCGGETNDEWMAISAWIRRSPIFLPPIPPFTYSTNSQGGCWTIAAKYNYYLLCLIISIPIPNASYAIPSARKAMMPARAYIYLCTQ